MVRCAGAELELPGSLLGGLEIADVCNFDLAVDFVHELILHCRAGRDTIELVYHWTREKNIDTIVNNNLRVPGETNADGSHVQTANGDKYGCGIYAASDISYGRCYGHGAHGALLCLAIPGRVL